jgi:hypothetical protein
LTDNNLYIGTSASEILHFVQIPPDPADPSEKPTYILASRLPPEYSAPSNGVRPGVQQILLLPAVNKACILCNSTVTFYSLPELSPVFGTLQVRNCNWIGGVDLDNPQRHGNSEFGPVSVNILISLGKRIRVVKIEEDELPRPLKSIDYAGSTISVRRGPFACVADTRSYALLDVDRQLKIPLFPISSLDDSQAGSVGGRAEDLSGGNGGLSRSSSAAQAGSSSDGRGHSRNTSLNLTGHRRGISSGDRSREHTPDRLLREASPAPAVSPSRPEQPETSPTDRSSSPEKPLPPPPAAAAVLLKPHIVSPSPQEFLLVTGTGPTDPGVGMFVNLDGDVTRSTLEFNMYPSQLLADGRGIDVDLSPENMEDNEEGYVIATMEKRLDGTPEQGLEIQRWDLDPAEGSQQKYWLPVPFPWEDQSEEPSDKPKSFDVGIRSVVDAGAIYFNEVVDTLKLQRFRPYYVKLTTDVPAPPRSPDSRTAFSVEQVNKEKALFESQGGTPEEALPETWEEERNQEELQFAHRLGQAKSKIAVWSGNHIWWATRNPMVLQLDAGLLAHTQITEDGSTGIDQPLDRQQVVKIINSLRGREAKTEAEFVSLGYVRQHAGLLLFIDMLKHPIHPPTISELRTTEEALVEGSLDPRVVLSLVPLFQDEIVEGRTGLWIHGGVKYTAEDYLATSSTEIRSDTEHSIPEHILLFLRQFLTDWRGKKGFGSIANENEVFHTVDAALLLVLLLLDKSSAKGPARAGSIRAELNDLVDDGIDCFDRAVILLNTHNRLYVLSRLYQSRRLASDVLFTWRRIIDGEADDGGEFTDGESEVTKYLTRINNKALVQEYGIWLATRNPKLGVQVFTEDRSRVKFSPTEVVALLRQGAPNAIKDYLEHLVFGKNHTEYVNELIAYYLDIVIDKLKTSESARSILAETYETYRAMRPPKPTYRQFITDNSMEEEWWHSRLRLLQLLGGSHQSVAEYDVSAILERIAPYTQELVPEIIILDGRQEHHQQALELLTHGLGDYDTAINYCLLGGSSIYHPISGTMSREKLPTREEQSKLLGYLLAEFLQIEDISNRVEQTGSLLERFGGWFDVGFVLSVIPDSWSVELVSGFLVSALRRIVREKSETSVAKALSGVENLKVTEEMIKKGEEIGPTIEAEY